MSIYEDLCEIQYVLKSPKGRKNAFGGFRYRKAEDILDAVKPILHSMKIAVVLTDEIVLIADRVFVKATATIRRGEEAVSCVAFARHPDEKKGMDESQITGSASSYARKYALAGLFAVNDEPDPDDPEQVSPGIVPKTIPGINPGTAPGPVNLPGMKRS